MNINKDKIICAFLLLIVYVLLDIGFRYIVWPLQPEFRYMAIDGSRKFLIALSYIGPVAMIFLLPLLRTSGLMYCLLLVILMLLIFPSSILVRFMNTDYRVFGLNTVYFFVVYATSQLFRFRFKVPNLKESQKTGLLLILSLILILPFVIIFGPYIDLSNLLLQNIYESRGTQRFLSNTYTSYMYSQLASVLLPLLLLLSILNRERLRAILAFLMLIFMYLVGAHKSVFFGTIVLIYFYYGNFYQKMKYMLLGMSVLIGASIVYYFAADNYSLIALIPYRIFYLPTLLDIGYFDVFEGQPIYWSDSILRRFVEYHHQLGPPFLVGQRVLHNPETDANAGILADGFMNFGVAGVLINFVLVGVVLSFLNSLRINHHFFGLIFFLLLNFSSGFFFTTMLTHGGIALLIVCCFFLKDSDVRYGAKT